MSLQAYQKTIQTTEDPRNMEYRLFAEITSDLIAAAERGIRDKQMVDAIHRNRRLWMALATDCKDPNNQLTKELRASFISLSLFVMKYSGSVMRDGEDIQELIDINRTIMKGLKPDTPVSPASPQPSAS